MQDGKESAGLDAATADQSAAGRKIEDLSEALASAQARVRILEHELQHRVRNMLSVIRSIFRRTRENGASAEEFAEHFQGRLDAVSRYQAYVDDEGSFGIELETMLRDELMQVQCMDGPNCTISGPPVHLRLRTAELMGLALHELATNSIKFGALAHRGQLSIEWFVEEQSEGRLLRFRWAETGVPQIALAPRPSGFGRQHIEDALPYQLGATTSFDLKPGGLECVILLPLHGAQVSVGDRNEQAIDQSPLLSSEAGMER